MFEKYALACVLMAAKGDRMWWRLLYSGAVQLLLGRTREGDESAVCALWPGLPDREACLWLDLRSRLAYMYFGEVYDSLGQNP